MIECAKAGFKQCVGVELNYPLVLYSRVASIRQGVHREARFLHANMFKLDMRDYDVTILFGTESMVLIQITQKTIIELIKWL